MSDQEVDRIIEIYLDSFDPLPDSNLGERTKVIVFLARKVCNV